ncbi:hypothetical protein FB446DRAFT_830354 [Lentinula raphanica]|nr:hypothetical protein FB446DRAFT_830354 [Lentinula raphanica]
MFEPPEELPPEEFDFHCRCGISTYAEIEVIQNTDTGDIIQCDSCLKWSHIACQKNGRAGSLNKTQLFHCDTCNMAQEMLDSFKLRTPGKGALVYHGKFHYPVRIIYTSNPKGRNKDEFQCTVKFWRECQFPAGEAPPPSIDVVTQDRIVDGLWGKQSERRKIRLGKWKHALPVLSSDDILDRFEEFPFTEEIDKALRPYIEELKKLYEDPEALSVDDVPAKLYISPFGKGVEAQIIPCSGNLTILEQAQIANWFEQKISHTTLLTRHTWFSLLPYAHAKTLFLDYRLQGNAIPVGNELRSERMQNAWNQQKSLSIPHSSDHIDVDMECLRTLETEMFMRSEEAGIAGWCQWGLDVGYHQENWNPYDGLQGLGCAEFFDEDSDALEKGSPY